MNINQILEKYWNAEASLQEEAELRAYFSSTDVAPEHEQFKDLFTFFTVGRLQTTNIDVEDILTNMSSIDLILDKYLSAETSLEEEAQLKDYFASNAVDPKHEEMKDLFTFYQISRNQTTDLDISSIINTSGDIDLLLEKYWNAEASLEEENLLRIYFSSNDVAEAHVPFKSMFEVYASKSMETTDLDIAQILKTAKNGQSVSDNTAMPKAAKTKVFSIQRWAVRIAAVFVLGYAAVTIMDQPAGTQYKGHATVLDEEAEAQEAYEITKQALALLSKNMNKGSKTIVESVSKAEKVSIFK